MRHVLTFKNHCCDPLRLETGNMHLTAFHSEVHSLLNPCYNDDTNDTSSLSTVIPNTQPPPCSPTHPPPSVQFSSWLIVVDPSIFAGTRNHVEKYEYWISFWSVTSCQPLKPWLMSSLPQMMEWSIWFLYSKNELKTLKVRIWKLLGLKWMVMDDLAHAIQHVAQWWRSEIFCDSRR